MSAVPSEDHSSHTHDASEGYTDDCAACRAFYEAVVNGVAVVMDCWINPDFRLALAEIDRLATLVRKIRVISRDLTLMLNGEYRHRVQRQFRAFKSTILELERDFPRNDRKRKERALEHGMVAFYEEYGRRPTISFRTPSKPDRNNDAPTGAAGERKLPTNRDTKLFVRLLRDAELEAARINAALVESGDRPPLEGKDALTPVAFGGDFRNTYDDVIKKWDRDGGPPRTKDVFPLVGKLDLWSD